jgi:hypothetical protein
MMKRNAVTAVLVMALMVWGSVTCEAFTGNELHNDLSGCAGLSTANKDMLPCIRGTGYVWGVADSLGFLCAFPAGVTYVQLVDVVKAYLSSHPEKRHELASNLVFEALAEAFPPPGTGSKGSKK